MAMCCSHLGVKFVKMWESTLLRLCTKSPFTNRERGKCVHYSLVGSEVVICGVDCSLYIRFGFFRSSHLLCVFYHRYSRARCFGRYILGLDLLTYPGLSSECAFRYMCVVKIYSVDLGI